MDRGLNEAVLVRHRNPRPLGMVKDNCLSRNHFKKEYKIFYDDFIKMNVQHRISNEK